MYAVGRIGNYITRGVSTVSGPFHPFGGAVDIVVVQQRDGSLKSSPWYVRFGKFQGVLKAKEKIVDVRVNGVESGFHMYLNPRGEAYFLREVDSEEIDSKDSESKPVKSRSLDCDYDQLDSVMDVNNARGFSRNLGFVLKRKPKEEGGSNRAEIAADLLEVKWSSNVSSETNDECRREADKDDGITCGRLEASLVLHEQHFVNNLENPETDTEMNSRDAREVDGITVANVVRDGNVEVYKERGSSLENCDSTEESLRNNEPETGLVTGEEPVKVVAESHTEVASIHQRNASAEVESSSVVAVSVCQAEDEKCTRGVNGTNKIRSSLKSNGESQDGSSEKFMEEQFVFGDLDDVKPSIDHIEVNQGGSKCTSSNYMSDSSPHRIDEESLKGNMNGKIRRLPSDIDIPRSCERTEEEGEPQVKSLPNMSRFDEFDPNNLDDSSYHYLDSGSRSSKWSMFRKNTSSIIKADVEKLRQLSDSECIDTISKELKDGNVAGGVSNGVDGNGKSWILWPFGKTKNPLKVQNCKKGSDVDNGSEANGEKVVTSPKANKRQIRTVTPTCEQLAALNLTEGKNIVSFTFSTAVLGTQQIEARIFLWKWETHIVISDVDGTITKSDVLGQFMPLVGRDWSHIGVTHLYSAIKENGYQILFLSARSISQAHITRQFLFNLKQDGKTLPDGPVVISPDGLFPSLFREVIRRAPHEFKIACLEDIRACFPTDWNPFYAGFGNRDTDEFSYLKVGIPKGKIFIINPKGEVVVNRCVDSKSYTSLHALVDDIFPPKPEHEHQD